MSLPFFLSLFLWTPVAIALLLLALPPRAGRGIFWGAGLLGAAAPLGLLALAPATLVRSWLPYLGASYDIALDGLSAGLVAVTAVVAIAAVASCTPGDRSTAASTLVAETAVVGASCTGDVLLMLSFAGVAIAAIAVLTASRRFAVVQWLGFALVLAVFTFCYHEAWSQTGFPTSSLSRMQSLVTFPELERWVFPVVAAGPLIMMLGVTSGRGAGKLFPAAYSLVPGLLLFRLGSSVFPAGASEHAAAMRALGVAFVLFACFAPRARLALALQGVFLAGLFSLESDGIVAAQIEWAHMALALTLWELGDEWRWRRPWVATLARFVVLLPPGGWLLLRSLPSGSAVALVVAWVTFNLRLWHMSRRARAREAKEAEEAGEAEAEAAPLRFGTLGLVPAVAMSLALYFAPSFYRSHLEPSLAPVLPTAVSADDESE